MLVSGNIAQKGVVCK